MKAQTEVFGLAIVVLLLSVGLLFAVSFMSKKESTSLKKEFTQTEVSYNLLGTMLETTTDCNNLRITELIQDCAENDFDNRVQCIGIDSCRYAESLIRDVFLKETLDRWNYKYRLEIQGADIGPISNPCTGEKKASAYIVPTAIGNVNIKLYLCG